PSSTMAPPSIGSAIGPPSGLRPGSHLAPPALGPFCLHPGSFLLLIRPGPV
ncbi:hypothetical protein M9458_043801, partial [Cirrhinus mrigala]